MKLLFAILLFLATCAGASAQGLTFLLTSADIDAATDTAVTKTMEIPNDSTKTVSFILSYAGPVKFKALLYVRTNGVWSEHLLLDSIRLSGSDSSATVRKTKKFGPWKMNSLMNLGLKNDTTGGFSGSWATLAVDAAACEFKQQNNFMQYRIAIRALGHVAGTTGAGPTGIGTLTVAEKRQ